MTKERKSRPTDNLIDLTRRLLYGHPKTDSTVTIHQVRTGNRTAGGKRKMFGKEKKPCLTRYWMSYTVFDIFDMTFVCVCLVTFVHSNFITTSKLKQLNSK